MRKQIFTLLCVLSVTLNFAQICTPDGSIVDGLRPASSAVACIQRGQSVSQTYTIQTPSQTGSLSLISTFKIDSIRNLPAGLSASFVVNPPVYTGGQKFCFLISGATNAPCGQYFMKIYATIRVDVFGNFQNFSGELTALATSNDLTGFDKPFLRVTGTGDTCPVVNSAQTTDFAAYSICTSTDPIVTTDAATNITANTTKLNATVNANANNCTIAFEYGTTSSYGSTIASTPSSLSTSVGTPVYKTIAVFSNQLYHYRVKVTYNALTVYGSDQTFTSAIASGIDNIEPVSMKVYPNPAQQELTIETGTEQPCFMILTNLMGEKIRTAQLTSSQTILDISTIPPGVYTITLSAGNSTQSKRVVIQNNK